MIENKFQIESDTKECIAFDKESSYVSIKSNFMEKVNFDRK